MSTVSEELKMCRCGHPVRFVRDKPGKNFLYDTSKCNASEHWCMCDKVEQNIDKASSCRKHPSTTSGNT